VIAEGRAGEKCNLGTNAVIPVRRGGRESSVDVKVTPRILWIPTFVGMTDTGDFLQGHRAV
jgi:hypothetical protein